MKNVHSIKLIGVSMLFIVGIAACNKPGPAETAGRKMDQTVEDTGKKIDAAGSRLDEKMSEQSAKTGVAIDDTEITTKVKAAIFAEPGLKTLQISVDTVKGVVTLSGSVDSQLAIDRAKAVASAVAGVNGVENRLVLKSGM